MQPPLAFRFQVRDLIAEALGPPQVLTAAPGEIYRWTLPRPYGVTFYITLDSPEHPHMAHVMLSDGPRYQPRPVESVVMYTREEAEVLVQRILRQWRGPG